jgi:hypothetical protein
VILLLAYYRDGHHAGRLDRYLRLAPSPMALTSRLPGYAAGYYDGYYYG